MGLSSSRSVAKIDNWSIWLYFIIDVELYIVALISFDVPKEITVADI